MSVNSRDRSDGVTQLCLKWDKGGMYLSKFVLLGFGVFWGGIVCLCFCCFYLVCWVGFFFGSLGSFCYSSLLRSFYVLRGFIFLWVFLFASGWFFL